MSSSDDFEDPILESRKKKSEMRKKIDNLVFLASIGFFFFSFYQMNEYLFRTVNINEAIFWSVMVILAMICIVEAYLDRKIHDLIKGGSQ